MRVNYFSCMFTAVDRVIFPAGGRSLKGICIASAREWTEINDCDCFKIKLLVYPISVFWFQENHLNSLHSRVFHSFLKMIATQYSTMFCIHYFHSARGAVFFRKMSIWKFYQRYSPNILLLSFHKSWMSDTNKL